MAGVSDYQRRGQRAYDKAMTAPRAVTNRKRYTAKHMLTAELLVGVGLVAVRAVADYEPQADGTLKGKIAHPKGQYGPLPILAGLIVSFFLLSFLAARGGTKAKVAVVAGGLLDLVLAMKSIHEFDTVSKTFSSFGKAKTPAGAWQTSGTIAGSPFGPAPSSGGTGSGGGNGWPTQPKHGKCPPGYTKVNGTCVANVSNNLLS